MAKQARIVDFEEARRASRRARQREAGRSVAGAAYDELSERDQAAARLAARQQARSSGSLRQGASSGSRGSRSRDAQSANSASRSGRASGSLTQASGRRSTGRGVSSYATRAGAYDDVDAYRDPYDDDYQADAQSRAGHSSAGDALRSRQHDARKRKADRLYDRTIAPEPDASADAGPRAALYRGQMGSSQKRSQRLQEGGSARSVGRGASMGALPAERSLPGFRWWMVPIALVLALLLVGFFVYEPARDYYTSVRNEAKAQAELDILQERNDYLQNEIDTLSTDQGVEDRARAEYGWVRDGENSVIVSGLGEDGIGTADSSAFASATDVPAPETWYSGFLDPFFGYEG